MDKQELKHTTIEFEITKLHIFDIDKIFRHNL